MRLKVRGKKTKTGCFSLCRFLADPLATLQITMIARGCVVFVILAKCVLSIPVSPSHVDHEDIKVIKCIVEVLANALSKRHSAPVSQRCQETLLTDDRLVTILRHHNFLQELQDIAAEGANERTDRRMEDGPNNESKQPKVLESIAADQSMLVAMERPKVGAEKRGATENEARERESGENNEIPAQDEVMEGEEEQDKEEDKQAMTKKRENKEEQENAPAVEEEEDEGAGPDTPGQHSEAKKSADEEKHEEKTTEKRRGVEEEAELKRWSPARQLIHTRAETSARSHHHQQETTHHSKEEHDPGEEVWKSTEEEHDLRMTARRDAEDHREEEGSASKKTEDGEIEGLAAIESELESVAQKLHEIRHG